MHRGGLRGVVGGIIFLGSIFLISGAHAASLLDCTKAFRECQGDGLTSCGTPYSPRCIACQKNFETCVNTILRGSSRAARNVARPSSSSRTPAARPVVQNFTMPSMPRPSAAPAQPSAEFFMPPMISQPANPNMNWSHRPLLLQGNAYEAAPTGIFDRIFGALRSLL